MAPHSREGTDCPGPRAAWVRGRLARTFARNAALAGKRKRRAPRGGLRRGGHATRGSLAAAAFAAAALACGGAPAAPDAELWERWTAHDPASTATVDHGAWDRLLARFVRPGPDGANRFAYAEADADARAELDAWIASLAGIRVSALARPEQKAYWINLYNALTVRTVLRHYPVESIRDIDISPGLFSDGPWGAALVGIEGEDVTLDDIEHRILRPVWRDPRLHYALNCAAAGCPELAAEAYRADALEAQLDRAARAYVNHPRGVEIAANGVRLSRIYDWYAEDFGADRAELFAHLARYAEPALAAALAQAPRISGYRYDWALNDAARAAAGAR